MWMFTKLHEVQSPSLSYHSAECSRALSRRTQSREAFARIFESPQLDIKMCSCSTLTYVSDVYGLTIELSKLQHYCEHPPVQSIPQQSLPRWLALSRLYLTGFSWEWFGLISYQITGFYGGSDDSTGGCYMKKPRLKAEAHLRSSPSTCSTMKKLRRAAKALKQICEVILNAECRPVMGIVNCSSQIHHPRGMWGLNLFIPAVSLLDHFPSFLLSVSRYTICRNMDRIPMVDIRKI